MIGNAVPEKLGGDNREDHQATTLANMESMNLINLYF